MMRGSCMRTCWLIWPVKCSTNGGIRVFRGMRIPIICAYLALRPNIASQAWWRTPDQSPSLPSACSPHSSPPRSIFGWRRTKRSGLMFWYGICTILMGWWKSWVGIRREEPLYRWWRRWWRLCRSRNCPAAPLRLAAALRFLRMNSWVKTEIRVDIASLPAVHRHSTEESSEEVIVLVVLIVILRVGICLPILRSGLILLRPIAIIVRSLFHID